MTILKLLLLLCLYQKSTVTASDDIIGSYGEGSGELPQQPILESVEPSNNQILLSEAEALQNETKKCLPKADIAFVLDTSGNIEQIYKEHIKWTVALVNALPVHKDGVRIAALQYAGSPVTEFSLGTYSNEQEISEHLKKIAFQSGLTRTGYALRKAEAELFRKDKGARDDAAKIIILFTDGLSIDDPLKPAHKLRDNKNVKIYVVSVGSDGFEPEMNRIAGIKDNVYGPRDLIQLKAALLKELKQLCPMTPEESKEQITSENKTSTDKVEVKVITLNESDAMNAAKTENIINEIKSIETTINPNPEITVSPNTSEITSQSSVNDKTFDLQSEVSIEEKAMKQKTTELPQLEKIVTTTDKQIFETDRAHTEMLTTEAIGIKSNSIDSKAETIDKTDKGESENADKNEYIPEIPVPPTAKPIGISKKKDKHTEKLEKVASQSEELQRDLASVTKTSVFSEDKLIKFTTKLTTPKRSTTRRVTTPKPYYPRRTDGQCPVDILFVVDSSGSVKSIYDRQKQYLIEILSEAQVADHEHRTALVQFAGNSHQRTEWAFDTYENKEDVMLAFSGVRHFTGTTYIGRALETALRLLGTRRAYVPTILVLLSDGFSQDDATVPADTIKRLPGVEFYAVSMSDLSNTEYLETLTGDPGRVYIGDESEELKRYLIKLFHCET